MGRSLKKGPYVEEKLIKKIKKMSRLGGEKKPIKTIKFFDRSGWTYRVEPDVTDHRLFEFLRIECVWFAPKDEAENIFWTLHEILKNDILSIGLEARSISKTDEQELSGEPIVQDIDVCVDKNEWIEVVGMHLHGRQFIEKLKID